MRKTPLYKGVLDEKRGGVACFCQTVNPNQATSFLLQAKLEFAPSSA
jgi:hypothetical protein